MGRCFRAPALPVGLTCCPYLLPLFTHLPRASILGKQKPDRLEGGIAGPDNCNALSIGSSQTLGIPQMCDFREHLLSEGGWIKQEGPEFLGPGPHSPESYYEASDKK